MSKKDPPLLYENALTTYFGSVTELARKPLPFKCKCGHEIYAIAEAYPHIRSVHKERLANAKHIKRMEERQNEST